MENRVSEIKTKHHFSSGTYAKQMELPNGWWVKSHKHKFDHMSILARGRVIVVVDGVNTTYLAPTVVTIEAGKEHSITALQDSTWFCIHGVDKEYDIESVDSVLIEEDI